MNPLDWMLAALVVYSTIRAAMRGLVRELFALGGLLVGLVLACWYYRNVAGICARTGELRNRWRTSARSC